ncbi:MAG: cyclophilin-like fold protein [Endomicrobiia bacterium]
MKKIKIKFPDYNLEIISELNNTNLAKDIYEILPQESKVNTWGQEIYFKLPLKHENEKPTLDVEIGDIGWWPDGSCFCIFFGRTPVSNSEKPKPYSEVTIIGKIKVEKDTIEKLKQVKSNSKVILEKL